MTVALAVVAYYEGYQPKAYLDPVQIWTICYGHTGNVKSGQVKTKQECEQLLAVDLGVAFSVIIRHVKPTIPMPDTRKAALASFVYNVGETNFKRSQLLRKLNAGDVVGACHELPRWVYAKGRKLPGLVKRRQAEMELCLKN